MTQGPAPARAAAFAAALVAGLVAVALAFALSAPWSGRADVFAVFALAQAVLCGAIFLARDGLPRGARGVIAVGALAVLVRAPFLAAPPTLSDDVYRYVLDGRLWRAGVNPYLVPPAALRERTAPGIAERTAPIVARVNHPQLATIYPPAAEAGFTLLAWAGAGARGARAASALSDVLAAIALALVLERRRASPWGAVLYALHPLAVVESAGSGHLEAWASLALVLAWERSHAGRRNASAVAWLTAVLVKPVALLAGPFLAPAWGRSRATIALAAATAGLVAIALESHAAGQASGVFAYLADWRHNDLAFQGLLALGVSDGVARHAVVGAVLVVVAALVARRATPVAGYAWAALVFLLASPVLHPWYALSLLVAAPLLGRGGPRITAWTLATVVLMTYVLPVSGGSTPGFRVLPLAVRLWEFAPVAIALVIDARLAVGRGEEEPWSGGASKAAG